MCIEGAVFPDGEIEGPNAEAQYPQTGTPQAHPVEVQRSQTRTLPSRTTNTVPDGRASSVFDPTLECSTGKVVLFWQSPSYFLQWSPASFVVDDVSCSCAE